MNSEHPDEFSDSDDFFSKEEYKERRRLEQENRKGPRESRGSEIYQKTIDFISSGVYQVEKPDVFQRLVDLSLNYFSDCIWKRDTAPYKSELEATLAEEGYKNIDGDCFAEDLITNLFKNRKK
jgi:hypothetical protein